MPFGYEGRPGEGGRSLGVFGLDRGLVFDPEFLCRDLGMIPARGGRLAPGRLGRFAALYDVFVASRGSAVTATIAARTAIVFVVGGALGAAFFVDQCLPVGNWDLVIVGVNFAECQEAMAIAAVIDKGGLQRRLNARHFRQIDIAS